MDMSANESTTQVPCCKLGEAVEFLIKHLAGTEMPSKEFLQMAEDAGIVGKTLSRAKRIVGAKSCRRNLKWYTSVPEEMKWRTFNISQRREKDFAHKTVKPPSVSTDWVSVTVGDGNRAYIPPTRESSGNGLRVKVGAYEFEADENFPTDKLAELLRGLAVNGQ